MTMARTSTVATLFLIDRFALPVLLFQLSLLLPPVKDFAGANVAEFFTLNFVTSLYWNVNPDASKKDDVVTQFLPSFLKSPVLYWFVGYYENLR
jgi:hypothetical protein